MRAYSLTNCPVCGKQISTNGLARTNHYRKHVREGRMTERRETFKAYPYSAVYFEVVRRPKEKP